MNQRTETDSQHTNRLIDETSPYLRQHAHNPVDWHAWGKAAFEKARQEDKPIFLSVGYSTCYWCHVMERQDFENETIAAQMNERFVNVKVDREERPDVDELYMTATQLLTGHGGWPMSVFLTPPGDGGASGLKPFWAGTYIPPEPQQGMPSFPQVLEGLSDAWHDRRDEVLQQADRVADAVTEHLRYSDTSGALSSDIVSRAASALLSRYDSEHGGIGGAPKFPQPAFLAFLLAVWKNNGDDSVRQPLRHTLDRMARGGVYDQVGGGFHRYSTDERWLVPHFEKMLYDNGQLVELYTDAYDAALSIDDKPVYEQIVRETCDYVLREMTDDTGAFWSAQDAEVEGREGGNYIWTREQVEQAIDDNALAGLAVRMYGLDRGANFQDPHHRDAEPANVLYLPEPLETLAQSEGDDLASLRDKRRRINDALKRERDRRRQPATDDKVLLGWNGMMIAGLARAGHTFQEPRYIQAAERAAEAILQHMTRADVDGELYRTMRNREPKIPAMLEDYAFFAHGLIELHRATDGEASHRYLELAQRYTKAAIDRFAAEQGGYYDTRAEQSDLFVRIRTTQDGVIPSGNSRIAHNLLDLAALSSESTYVDRALSDLRSFGQILDKQGVAMVTMQHALLRALEDAPQRVASEATGARDAAADEVVHVSAEPSEVDLSTGSATFVVSLRIDAAHHLNAAQPGDANLVATELFLQDGDGLALEVDYPAGETREYPFTDVPLAVYEGSVALKATLRKAENVHGGNARVMLRYQACTQNACLAAHVIEVPVTITGC